MTCKIRFPAAIAAGIAARVLGSPVRAEDMPARLAAGLDGFRSEYGFFGTTAAITATNKAFFQGMFDPARRSFLDRLAGRLLRSPVGDRRDWERIAAWPDDLAPRLASPPS
jgi:hypothetical protein